MITTDIIEQQQKYEMDVYPRRNIAIVRGRGSKVWDADGREYVDCIAGHGVANIGHCHPAVIHALEQQARTLITCPGTFYNDQRARLLEKLVSIAPNRLTRAFLCNSGTEAIEAAIKFTRFTTGKPGIICAMRGFHGRTFGAMSATFQPAYKEVFEPLVPGFTFVPFHNADKLEAAVDDNTGAILLEIVQGEGGVNIGRRRFFDHVQQIARKRNLLLIIDEVQTGFGRTGKMFACEHYEIEPDIMCVAKALAGGLPMGAVLCADNVLPPKGKHGSTFGGNPLVCAAALAAIEVIEQDDLVTAAAEKGAYFADRLRAINSPLIREVRHLGLMVGIELKQKVQPFLVALMERGVLALPAGATVLRFLPPLTISTTELNVVAEVVHRVLAQSPHHQ